MVTTRRGKQQKEPSIGVPVSNNDLIPEDSVELAENIDSSEVTALVPVEKTVGLNSKKSRSRTISKAVTLKRPRTKAAVVYSSKHSSDSLSMSTFLWSNPVDGVNRADYEVRAKKRKLFKKRKQDEYKNNRLERLKNEREWRSPRALIEAQEESNEDPFNLPKEDDAIGPTLEINADGEIVVNEKSLTHRETFVGPTVDDLQDLGEEYGYVTTATFSRKKKKARIWKSDETSRFYNALRQLGQDFYTIALMFPNRSRLEIKNKFKKEQKTKPDLIKAALDRRSAKDFDVSMLSTKVECKMKKELVEINKHKTLDDLFEEQNMKASTRPLLPTNIKSRATRTLSLKSVEDLQELRKRKDTLTKDVDKQAEAVTDDVAEDGDDVNFSFDDFTNFTSSIPGLGVDDVISDVNDGADDIPDGLLGEDDDDAIDEADQLDEEEQHLQQLLQTEPRKEDEEFDY